MATREELQGTFEENSENRRRSLLKNQVPFVSEHLRGIASPG
jgi:hypothetical protein